MEKLFHETNSSEEVGGAPRTRQNISFKVCKQRNSAAFSGNKLTDSFRDQDFVHSVEDKKIKGTARVEKRKPLVVPPLRKNIWRIQTKENGSKDDVEKLAVEELLRESAAENEKWEKRSSDKVVEAIPILMQNKIPDGYETNQRLDVSLRPDESNLGDYESVPVDLFGTAVLRGLGCNPGDPVGNTNKRVVAPIEAVVRSKGLGLGADIKPNKRNHSHSSEKQREELPLVKGAYVRLLEGNDKGHYGKVEGLDESRVVINVTQLEKIVTVPHQYAEVVSAREFKKESKVLNRSSYDAYTQHHKPKHEDILTKSGGHLADVCSEDNSTERQTGRESSKHSHKKRKHSSDRHKSGKKQTSDKEGLGEMWIRPLLRVRFIDQHYKKGKYFNQKVTIDDVLSYNNCACKTEDGKYLEGISQSCLETVIPRSESAYIMVVKGRDNGQLGTILKRDKANCIATITFLSDRERISKINYDSICEYVGDVSQYD